MTIADRQLEPPVEPVSPFDMLDVGEILERLPSGYQDQIQDDWIDYLTTSDPELIINLDNVVRCGKDITRVRDELTKKREVWLGNRLRRAELADEVGEVLRD